MKKNTFLFAIIFISIFISIKISSVVQAQELKELKQQFFALNMADALSTLQAITITNAKELNPIVAPFAKNNINLIAYKMGVSFIVLKVLEKNLDKNELKTILKRLNFLLSTVVSNNVNEVPYQKMHLNFIKINF